MGSLHMPGQRSRLESVSASSACWNRGAFVQDRPVSRSRKEQWRHARCSSRRPKHLIQALSAFRSQKVYSHVRRSAAGRASDASTSNPVPGGREFFNWIVDLPWNRLGVWLVVAWFVYQLKDFFGVSGRSPFSKVVSSQQCSELHPLPGIVGVLCNTTVQQARSCTCPQSVLEQ